MNDAGGDHGVSSPNAPLGVEVRAQAFLYGYTTETTSPVLSQTTFIRYEILNRGRQSIEQMHASLFADPDLGDAGDDYIGSDTLRHMGIVYNDSNEDSGYGSPPPAFGIQVLQGPIGLANERIRMTAANTFISGGPAATNDPGTAEEYYNFMRGLWGDGTPYYEFGNAYGQAERGAQTTTFMFAGDPVTESFYSEMNVDDQGTNSPGGDRRLVVSTGPFRLVPDSSQTLLYAFPYGQGTSHLQSVEVLQWRGDVLQRLASAGFFTSRPVEGRPTSATDELALSKPHPNPSRQPEVVLTLPEAAHVRATVYDALGRQLEVLADLELAEGETVLQMPDGLAPGTYLLRVEVAPGAVETLPFTIVR